MFKKWYKWGNYFDESLRETIMLDLLFVLARSVEMAASPLCLHMFSLISSSFLKTTLKLGNKFITQDGELFMFSSCAMLAKNLL